MKQTFYSNGKLLITGEYLVLDGALALALPTKFGQHLVVKTGLNHEIVWTSYDSDGSIWFNETILFSDIENKTTFENNSIKSTLIQILHEAFLLNSKFIQDSDGYFITTTLTFPKFWGLGTSSTLINNIATWLQVDAFVLLNNSFGGSGYDIACAQNNEPIIYNLANGKPVINKIKFNPDCKENIYFLYLNKKQSSKNAIANYSFQKQHLDNSINQINTITANIQILNNYEYFANAIIQHEDILSKILQMPTIQSDLFPDFDGKIKSLGAWGGDFVMVLSKKNPANYFSQKGYFTILSYQEMILEF